MAVSRSARCGLAGLFAACAFWLAPAAALAADPPPCDPPQAVASAERVIAPRTGGLVRREIITLPDRLGLPERAAELAVRYRIDTRLCQGRADAALRFFRVGASFSVRDDQGRPLTLLSTGGRIELADVLPARLLPDQPVHNGRIPSLFALPADTQWVEVTLAAPSYIPSGLVQAELGSAQALLPRHAASLENVVAFADAASGVALVMGVMALVLWLPRRADRALLWLAIACGLWGVRGLAYFSPTVPVAPLLFEQFNPINILLAQAAVAAGVMALMRVTQRRLHRLLWGATGVSAAVLIVATAAGVGVIQTRALCFLVTTIILLSLIVGVWRLRRQSGWRLALMLGSLVTLLGCAMHDVQVMTGRLPASEPSYVFWGFVILLVAFAALSAHYVVAMLNRAEQTNEELERHVRAKTAELEQSYARLRDRERESARTQERERLLRDMHDGLGAQLMTALRGLERGALAPPQIRQSLQDSLDELRLLMDSTDMGHYLPGALAAWRNRWDHRLAAAGVQLAWHIDESLDDVQLPSDSALQVMRILQEAVTNIVKHAQARHMTLAARVEPGSPPVLAIAIRDDGRGLPPAAERPGARGLKNMAHRAGQIGGEVSVRSRTDAPGTEVLLRVPLAEPAQATSPRRAASIAASAREEMPSLR